MATVLDISMSLDGYVAGKHDGLGHGLGDNGEPIHNWVMGGEWTSGEESFAAKGIDRELLDTMLVSAGSAIVGRRMFDVVDGWGDDPPWHLPVFVLTTRPLRPQRRGDTIFVFVADGVESAHRQAVDAAGGKNVHIGGGASIAQQFLAAGLVDELQLHIAPLLLGSGVRLFEHLDNYPIRLEQLRVQHSEFATHIRYRVNGASNG